MVMSDKFKKLGEKGQATIKKVWEEYKKNKSENGVVPNSNIANIDKLVDEKLKLSQQLLDDDFGTSKSVKQKSLKL